MQIDIHPNDLEEIEQILQMNAGEPEVQQEASERLEKMWKANRGNIRHYLPFFHSKSMIRNIAAHECGHWFVYAGLNIDVAQVFSNKTQLVLPSDFFPDDIPPMAHQLCQGGYVGLTDRKVLSARHPMERAMANIAGIARVPKGSVLEEMQCATDIVQSDVEKLRLNLGAVLRLHPHIYRRLEADDHPKCITELSFLLLDSISDIFRQEIVNKVLCAMSAMLERDCMIVGEQRPIDLVEELYARQKMPRADTQESLQIFAQFTEETMGELQEES